MKQISILLGAGFSIPKGYPSAVDLNKAIQSFKPNEWSVGPAYELYRVDIADSNTSGHSYLKQFLSDMIQFFSDKFSFDYEEFYDFLVSPKEYMGIKNEFDFERDFPDRLKSDRLSSNCHQALVVYNKLIPTFIKDREGRNRYPQSGYGRGTLDPYNNFLSLLEKIGEKYDAVHIHTLNHDSLFESFKNSDYLDGKLSDGFEELGSNYYGVLRADAENEYTVRLQYYTDVFIEQFRLYKLHGSVDYAPFRNRDGYTEAYLKTVSKVGIRTFSRKKLGVRKLNTIEIG